MSPTLTVTLSDFALDALARGRPRGSEEAKGRLVRATRFYLNEAAAQRPGWSVPTTLRPEREGTEVSVELDEDLLHRVQEEAGKQDVSLSRLVSQAVIYYAAEYDAGRITQRVLDELEGDEGAAAS